jgi:hypothetical protein
MPSKAQDDMQTARERPGYYSCDRRRGTICWQEANLLETFPRYGKMPFVGVVRRISIPQGGYSVRLRCLAPASSDARKRHSCKEQGPTGSSPTSKDRGSRHVRPNSTCRWRLAATRERLIIGPVFAMSKRHAEEANSRRRSPLLQHKLAHITSVMAH